MPLRETQGSCLGRAGGAGLPPLSGEAAASSLFWRDAVMRKNWLTMWQIFWGGDGFARVHHGSLSKNSVLRWSSRCVTEACAFCAPPLPWSWALMWEKSTRCFRSAAENHFRHHAAAGPRRRHNPGRVSVMYLFPVQRLRAFGAA